MQPTNEAETVIVFAQMCEAAGWEIVSMDASFPDAIIRHRETGEIYQVEFEYLASSFVAHKHDLRQVDVIICWKNDWKAYWPDCPITIWALSDWQDKTILSANPIVKENVQLKLEMARLQYKLDELQHHLDLLSRASEQEVGIHRDIRQDILNAVSEGYIGSITRLASTIGTSRQTIYAHLNALEEEGIINRDKGKAIRLTGG